VSGTEDDIVADKKSGKRFLTPVFVPDNFKASPSICLTQSGWPGNDKNSVCQKLCRCRAPRFFLNV
jgi:hypothetical protein